MLNARPRQFAYACGIPLGQRRKPPQRNCLAMFNNLWMNSSIRHNRSLPIYAT